ncbi:MAG: GNAT family N-acetyltransferase [Bacteroidota bacterium]
MHKEYRRGKFSVSADPSKLDIEAIHDFLTHCYWSEGISKKTVARAIEHSLCFGLFEGNKQIGFARVISDRATYAYLCDVYVLETYRGKGLGTWLMSCVMKHPDLQGLRRFTLLTRDAHGLYQKFGFTAAKNPSRYMEIHNADIYKKSKKEK